MLIVIKISRIERYLRSKGYATWYLFIDSRTSKPGIFSLLTNCFPYYVPGDDYGKLVHLQLFFPFLTVEHFDRFLIYNELNGGADT